MSRRDCARCKDADACLFVLLLLNSLVVDRSRKTLFGARLLKKKGCYSFLSNALKTRGLNRGEGQLRVAVVEVKVFRRVEAKAEEETHQPARQEAVAVCAKVRRVPVRRERRARGNVHGRMAR